ncbi:VOC family protein [Membranihabitans marinus]|nr:VOC family protein [Membranihabitans marinus]
MSNPVVWFEIATTNLERAKNFYTAVFKRNLQYMEMPDTQMYMFEGDEKETGAMGALVHAKECKPSSEGTVIYFNSDDVSVEIARVKAAGGQVIFPKMSIGEFGFIAQFIDTEGNTIGLHSTK